MTNEIKAYFMQKYAKAGFIVIDIPDFQNKKEVNDWIAYHQKSNNIYANLEKNDRLPVDPDDF